MSDKNNEFDYEYRYLVRGSQAEKEWRLRVQRRRDIYDRLKAVGKLSLLGGTSLLVGMDDEGLIENLAELETAKGVFYESHFVKNHLNKAQKKRILKAPSAVYQRIEEAYRCFMLSISVACRLQDDLQTIKPFNQLKLWCLKMVSTDESATRVLDYLKWVIKTCQVLLLAGSLTSPEPYFPSFDLAGYGKTPLPFFGELVFVNHLYLDRLDMAVGIPGTRKAPLNCREFDTLAQLCMGNRAQPYPVLADKRAAVEKVIGILKTPKVIPKEALDRYKDGLHRLRLLLPKNPDLRTHFSLSNSGCIELPREYGGKSAKLVYETKKLLEGLTLLTEGPKLIGRRDHLGQVLVDSTLYLYYKEKGEDIPLRLALYRPSSNLILQPDEIEAGTPFRYEKCILLTCSKLLREIGTFNEEDPEYHFPIFSHATKPKFKPGIKSVPTRVSLVEEAGRKTRLVTTTLVAKAQLEQSLNHIARAWLSSDPFLQIGFEEPHKLYELLRRYQREKFPEQLMRRKAGA